MFDPKKTSKDPNPLAQREIEVREYIECNVKVLEATIKIMEQCRQTHSTQNWLNEYANMDSCDSGLSGPISDCIQGQIDDGKKILQSMYGPKIPIQKSDQQSLSFGQCPTDTDFLTWYT